ncbi:hypothetical protein HPB51_011427 [Rhipicephalus microplus]|uniref:Uncharacterized protein n=1 Tax=Rhipicephalus microplus TaxID=6941 RepID=A0A9J6EGJ5_RHIMP|nr:hypothetical protein HPB51_011427 [Rhipicephalus microplus]
MSPTFGLAGMIGSRGREPAMHYGGGCRLSFRMQIGDAAIGRRTTTLLASLSWRLQAGVSCGPNDDENGRVCKAYVSVIGCGCGEDAILATPKPRVNQKTPYVLSQWSSGPHEHNGVKYRFMVMDTTGEDLLKVLDQQGKTF